MHYGDKEHLKKAFINIVVYKHINAQHQAGLFDYQICSIQDCKYFSTQHIVFLEEAFDNIFKKELKRLKPETFYHVKITLKKTKNQIKMVWKDAIEITDAMLITNPHLGVH